MGPGSAARTFCWAMENDNFPRRRLGRRWREKCRLGLKFDISPHLKELDGQTRDSPLELRSRMNKIMIFIGCMMVMICQGWLSYSHYTYSKRTQAARTLPEGVDAKPGRIYFASFPENRLALDIWGWHPNVGHASLVTRDNEGPIRQYDYGWFVGSDEGERPDDAIGYVDKSASYGVVRRKTFSGVQSAKATNDLGIARMVLENMPGYGEKVELWAKDVEDIGVAERYMELLAEDQDRGSMAWRCWQIGGYRCGNITRQAFDAARGEGHFLDLLWGGFPGADAPSIGTDKTVYMKE